MTKLLIVDDDPDVLLAARLLLKRHIDQVDIEKNPDRLPFLLNQTRYDAILLDMNFRRDVNSGKEGFAWLDRILDLDPGAVVILLTAYGDVEMAVRAIKAGATDFVLKPWENDKLIDTVKRGLATRPEPIPEPIVGSVRSSRPFAAPAASPLLTRNPTMLHLLDTIRRVAPTDANVLVLGENGTGKDLVAREIHRLSARAGQPFVAVDLGALTESLFESELFGHVKGAFTDARADRAGRFEEARGGTIFLDEIGNISGPQQARLLTVLQQRVVTRVGSNNPLPVDVRLVCATNLSLSERIEAGSFRQDLLFRINTIELHLPPLRDRPDDLPLLADYFLRLYAGRHHRAVTGIDPELLARWQHYAWPGNVRELQHTIERAVILATGPQLRSADWQPTGGGTSPKAGADPVGETMQLDILEKQLIQRALQQYAGNITDVARVLGLSRQALYRRMDKYGL